MPILPKTPRLTKTGSTMLLFAGALAISACASKAPKELPPEPGPATTTQTPSGEAGPTPGSQADFAAKMMGADVITVPAQGLGHDLEAMAAAITPQTRVVFVANPNNPTGTLATRDEVTSFLAAVPEHVLLVMDEAYIEFLNDPVDLLPLIRAGTHPHILLMRTFSKIFGLAGLRLGYGIGSPALISALEKVRQPFNINAIAQAGALAALDDSEHLAATRHNNRQGLDLLEGAFRQMGLEFVPSAGNFVLVRVGDGAKVFGELQKRGIIVRPMAGYGLPEWIRISVGTSHENARCLAALREISGK